MRGETSQVRAYVRAGRGRGGGVAEGDPEVGVGDGRPVAGEGVRVRREPVLDGCQGGGPLGARGGGVEERADGVGVGRGDGRAQLGPAGEPEGEVVEDVRGVIADDAAAPGVTEGGDGEGTGVMVPGGLVGAAEPGVVGRRG
ncbi:hypothetical protein ACFQFR_08270 [Streptomyces goshikiensis]